MKTQTLRQRFGAVGLLGLAVLLGGATLSAHCDRLDGPVVMAARQALADGKVELALAWVQEADETEIRRVFEQVLAVRKLSPEAHVLADRYFFETLVRLHRAGEGAPFTGLQPAGGDPGPAIATTDAALEKGDATAVLALVSGKIEHGIQEHFEAALAARRKAASGNVADARAAVRAYVTLVHCVDGIYRAAESPGTAHPGEAVTANAAVHGGHHPDP